ncbi:MAG: OmpA family protein [Phycisphaerae bacterium]|nr:OmpA family protein [Phycisphaerae bacterium]
MVLTNIIRKLSLPVVLGLLVIVAVGCDEDKLRLHNQQLTERNEKLQQENDRLGTDHGLMENELNLNKRKMVSQSGEVSRLKSENARLKDGVLELQKIIDEHQGAPLAGRPLPAELNMALIAFARANPQIAEFDPALGMIKFKSDLTFNPGSDQVKPKAVATLKKLVKILNTPEGKRFAVYVAGHTDDVPIGKSKRRHPTNWYLSAHRAVGVQQVLEKKAGLAGNRIAVVGFGEYHPVEPNETKGGRKVGSQKNRRVEIWIVSPGAFLTDKPKATVAPAPKAPTDVVVDVEETVIIPNDPAPIK